MCLVIFNFLLVSCYILSFLHWNLLFHCHSSLRRKEKGVLRSEESTPTLFDGCLSRRSMPNPRVEKINHKKVVSIHDRKEVLPILDFPCLLFPIYPSSSGNLHHFWSYWEHWSPSQKWMISRDFWLFYLHLTKPTYPN